LTQQVKYVQYILWKEWINFSNACWGVTYLLCVTIMCFLFLSPSLSISQVIFVNISLFFCSYFPTTVSMKCFYSQQLWYQMWVGFSTLCKAVVQLSVTLAMTLTT
jgi:hypothetical protein